MVGSTPTIASPMTSSPTALERLLSKGRLRSTVYMLGPAFVASIAYVDPGNLATNVQGGARCGYLVLWVVLAASLMAMSIQYLSAKLGIVTDQSLAQMIRARWPRPLTWGCGFRRRSWRCRPTSQSSSTQRSG
jgi:manganese transport protein